ncbi:UNKNOWN [Stylonychia lemnae]|uniref:Homeobox domain-containing protein n=1 Tax=Stylonychia lemnae TaxID=5949 RepID=A0A078B4U7_STYLE|nr:UNKNOWN [Stylonychia lemnae]|eukprot:CDW88553.1 UNKNOWN [Stylonychia lemnae]
MQRQQYQDLTITSTTQIHFPATHQPQPGAFRVPSPKKAQKLMVQAAKENFIYKPMPISSPILSLSYFNQFLLNQTTQNFITQSLRNQAHSPPNESTNESSLVQLRNLVPEQKKLKHVDDVTQLQQLNSQSSSCSELTSTSKILGKRKRKSERDLSFLRTELKKDFLWSREKINQISKKLDMNETQVYKWWWDQTRKRQKILSKSERDFIKNVKKSVSNISQENSEELMGDASEFLIPSTDEFGGYSSRLRLHEVLINQNEREEQANLEQNLCKLLGIDIEAMALAIIMEDKKKMHLSQQRLTVTASSSL